MAGRSKKLDATVLSGFCAEVALMLGSGMALYDGIAALHESAPAGPQAEVYARLSENIAKTGSLGEALGADDCWPRYLAHMAAVGERTGRLEEVMEGLSGYYEREARVREAVASAAAYPMILGAMLVVIVLVMILKVLPVFRQVLGSMGVGMTEAGLALMRLGTGAGWAVLALVALLLAAALAVALLLLLAGGGKDTDLASQEEQRIAEVLSQMAGTGRVEVALFYGGETDALGARTAGPTGAVVVAEGADDLSVRLSLIRAMRTLLGLPESAVDVFVMEEERR